MGTEIGDNSGEATFRVTSKEVRNFVERVERLEGEKKEVAEQIKDVYAEAKARGYDVKALRAVIRRRKQKRDDVEEQDAIIALIEDALGIFE